MTLHMQQAVHVYSNLRGFLSREKKTMRQTQVNTRTPHARCSYPKKSPELAFGGVVPENSLPQLSCDSSFLSQSDYDTDSHGVMLPP